MSQKYSNTKTVFINSPVSNVWRALTDPAMIKNYFFGIDSIGEWKEGNTIISKGEWRGKKFLGKAKILQFQQGKLLRHSYWSDMSGLPDQPENYHIITHELNPEGVGTRLTLTEENLSSPEMKDMSGKLWDKIFENLKKLLEQQTVE